MSWKITSLYFFSSSNIYFSHKEPIKTKDFLDFRVLWSKFVKFFMSILKGQVNSASVFVSFFNVMTHYSTVYFWNSMWIPLQILYPSSASWITTPLYFFSSNNIYFVQKKPIKVKNFETFKCSGENLSNSFWHFWNVESIPLQILYHSSVSWKTTPLHFFLA